MRSKILPFALIVAIGAGSAAMASQSYVVTGVIKTIDTKASSLTLDNGKIYMLPKGHSTKDLKVGEKVQVTWDKKGTGMEATAIVPAK